jgi:hypothetical protein
MMNGQLRNAALFGAELMKLLTAPTLHAFLHLVSFAHRHTTWRALPSYASKISLAFG